MALVGAFNKVSPPPVFINYSTFPPSYTIINPPKVPLVVLPSSGPPLVQQSRPTPTPFQWITRPVIAQPSIVPDAWLFSSSTRPTPLSTDQAKAIRDPYRHPPIRYNLLSAVRDQAVPRAASQFLPIRPFGVNTAGVPLPNNAPQSDFDWNIMTTLFHNVTSMIANSVVASTQCTYKTGWKRWITFTATIGTDRYLQTIPPAFNQYVDQAQHAVQMSWAILACCGYLAYLISHPVKPTEAPTATNYLSAVRYNLKTFGMDISFMDSSSFLKSARAGCIKGWQSLPGNSASDRQTLPVSIAMLETSAQETLDMANLSHHALYTACICAYTLLCRVSEYLKRPQSNHHLRSQYVVFWIKHLNAADVTDISPYLYVASSDAWRYPKSRLLGVSVTIKDSKADQEGASDKYAFPRYLGPYNPNNAYEFSEVLFDLAIRAKPLHDQPFFSCSTGERLVLTADIMNKWLKTTVAPRFGLNSKRVHTHSLRFAGASTLAAAKIEDSVIMKMGRWKSLAFLGYIRMAKEIFARVAAALADRTILPPADVRNLMPGL